MKILILIWIKFGVVYFCFHLMLVPACVFKQKTNNTIYAMLLWS